MDRKLIFLDIDGTLIAAMARPSAFAAEAVQRARKNGHKVFLCTGRNMPIISQDILAVGFDGVIASAGAYVQVGKQVLFERLLREETVQECLEVFHSHNIFCRIESPEGIYTDPQMEALLRSAESDQRNSELIRMQKEIETGMIIQPYEKYPRKGAYKICFTSTSLEAVEMTKRYLGSRFRYVVHSYGNSTSCFNGEIIPHGIDKGAGMAMVCRYFGAELNDAVAFGDSMNDYEMMECAGLSVAMGNSCEEIKNVADCVCESVEQEGIYHEFRRLGLTGEIHC